MPSKRRIDGKNTRVVAASAASAFLLITTAGRHIVRTVPASRPADIHRFCSQMKLLLVILVLAITKGCGLPLSRPTPSESQYRKRFLGTLTEEQVQDLRFAYRGAIGGESSIAQFTTDPSGIMAIRVATKREEVYKPDRDEDREYSDADSRCAQRSGNCRIGLIFPLAKRCPCLSTAGI